MERQGINALARTKDGNTGQSGRPSQVTVLKLLADAGDTAIDFLDQKMRDLPVRYVEADEMFAFVGIRGLTLLKNAPLASSQPATSFAKPFWNSATPLTTLRPSLAIWAMSMRVARFCRPSFGAKTVA